LGRCGFHRPRISDGGGQGAHRSRTRPSGHRPGRDPLRLRDIYSFGDAPFFGFRQTGTGDSTTPTLVSFSFTPTVVDTSTQPATITVTACITDAGAGVATSSDDPFDCSVHFISPSRQQAFARLGWWQFVSGDTHDATYQSTFALPLHSDQGTWQVKQVHLGDRIGNQSNMWTADLAAAGFPTTLEVVRTEDRQERP
jgi:hypothetical protein